MGYETHLYERHCKRCGKQFHEGDTMCVHYFDGKHIYLCPDCDKKLKIAEKTFLKFVKGDESGKRKEEKEG